MSSPVSGHFVAGPGAARPGEKDVPLACVCAIGAFDGVHLGHQRLLADARADADRRGLPLVAVTFDPDPAEVLGTPQPLSRLLCTADRERLLLAAGADLVFCLDFSRELAALPWEGFARAVLAGTLAAASVHVGSNFRFGAQGAGTPGLLAAFGRAQGFATHAHGLVEQAGAPVSATRIRGLLRAGRVGEASRLLGRPHFVRGSVRHGRGEGTGFGFPTANVEAPGLACMPGEGVYAGWAVRGELAWPAAINVGTPPTFASTADPSFLEASLIGFEGDLYDADVAIAFTDWLRASRPFSSVEELERVVLGNMDWVRKNLGASARPACELGLPLGEVPGRPMAGEVRA